MLQTRGSDRTVNGERLPSRLDFWAPLKGRHGNDDAHSCPSSYLADGATAARTTTTQWAGPGCSLHLIDSGRTALHLPGSLKNAQTGHTNGGEMKNDPQRFLTDSVLTEKQFHEALQRVLEYLADEEYDFLIQGDDPDADLAKHIFVSVHACRRWLLHQE